MGGADQFGIEIQAVASYQRRSLLIGAKEHNVLTLGWFRASAKFLRRVRRLRTTCSVNLTSRTRLSPLRQMIFTGLVYRSSQQHKTGEANGCRHGEMSRDRTRHPHELLITQKDFAPHRLSHVSAYGQEGGEDVKMSNSNFLASHSGLEHGLIAQSC